MAIAAAAALAAASVSSDRFIRAGVESTSFRGQVRELSPFLTGLEIRDGGRAQSDGKRRADATALGRRLRLTERPVLTSSFPASVAGIAGQLKVVLMARTDAVAHVQRMSGGHLRGVWIASPVADSLDLHPGSRLRLGPVVAMPKQVVTLRVAGVYKALDADLSNPFWANFVQDIRAENPDAPLPPTFVLMSEPALVRSALRLGQKVSNVFEYPVDSPHVTFAGAKDLRRRYARARSLFGCRRCTFSSSLESALLVAERHVEGVSAAIRLVSACGFVLSLVIAGAAGLFLVRRRADEAELLRARGVAPSAFGARIAVEAIAPAAVGLGAGLLLAVITLRFFAPAGTLDGGTLRVGIRMSLAAAVIALAVVAVSAAWAFGRQHEGAVRPERRHPQLPWELAPLAVTVVLVVLVASGGGLASDPDGTSHPRIVVFLLPMTLAAAVAGLAVRALRFGLRGAPDRGPVAIFLAVRRLAFAGGQLVAVVVSAGTAIAVFASAVLLASSLDRTASVKAFVSNGSDVQGFVASRARIPPDLHVPAAIVAVDSQDFVADGRPVDVVAGGPSKLARVIRWGRWPNDPRRRLSLLERQQPAGGPLLALASPDMPSIGAVEDQGVVVPVRVVARVPVPGMSAGRPALLVSRGALETIARRLRIADPLSAANWLVWAKGEPSIVSRRLRQSSLAPMYLTTLRHVKEDPSVVAAKRSYRYFGTFGAVTTGLAFLALVLYLQARRRRQLIASALVRRMGLSRSRDLAAVVTETVLIALVAVTAGVGVAVAVARLIVPHVDPLPQYAPGTMIVYPWSTLVAGTLTTLATTVLASAVVVLGGRRSAAEALRVA